MTTSHERVVNWVRNNPGRHTNQEIAKTLNMPIGTVSSVTSVEYDRSLAHGGAGIYCFPMNGDARLGTYSWCHSKPASSDLYPRRTGEPKKKVKKAKADPNTDNTITLTRSALAPTVWHAGDKTYRLQEVTVEILIQPVVNDDE